MFRSLLYNKDTSWGGWKFNGVWSNLLVARCRTVELAAKNFDSLAKSPALGLHIFCRADEYSEDLVRI